MNSSLRPLCGGDEGVLTSLPVVLDHPSSEYLAAMLDVTKFKEGWSEVGNSKLYSKEVLVVVINYFYTGRILCKDLSLRSLTRISLGWTFSLKLGKDF